VLVFRRWCCYFFLLFLLVSGASIGRESWLEFVIVGMVEVITYNLASSLCFSCLWRFTDQERAVPFNYLDRYLTRELGIFFVSHNQIPLVCSSHVCFELVTIRPTVQFNGKENVAM
jgi:hypothetical protein